MNCLECISRIKPDRVAVFIGGVLFGTAGIKILSSRDAKKVYTNGVAAALRAKDCVMRTSCMIQENAEDILAEAQQINEERYKEADGGAVPETGEEEEKQE